MGKFYDLTKRPKIISNIISIFRKWKLSLYKNKKIKEDKKLGNKNYFIKFKIVIDDPINKHEFDREFEMIIPAKASFFAKKRVENVMKDKIKIYFTDIQSVSEKEVDDFEDSKYEYIVGI